MLFKFQYIIVSILIICSCTTCKVDNTSYNFNTLTANNTGLHFNNKLTPTTSFNMLKYMYFYNGAGVGVGDFNNDGLQDVFFAANQIGNAMYLNKGKMQFAECTEKANIITDSAWNTGVSVVDINNDGMLDIYISRVGNYKMLHAQNQLLVCKQIKNGTPIYEDEAAAYHLNFSCFSTQAAFFDMDNDGDLDMYLLNHSVNHDGNFAPRANFTTTTDTLAGDKLLKNNNGIYTEVTVASGINNTKIGYGLGIVISDINMDGYADIYIGNDFHENDYMYINQKNGTFKDECTQRTMHTSQFTMGVDAADINNDAYPEIISADMLPEDPKILKRSLGEDDYQNHNNKISIGYHNQYSHNNLQINTPNGMFAETSFYSGIAATDWSWSTLFVDFDNDTNKDLFISNGIPKRLNDMDYINYLSNDVLQNKIQTNTLDQNELDLINKFPEIKLPNKFFINKQNLLFDDISNTIKASPNTYSNGAAYADFDNDGDMDIIVNNINDESLIYENKIGNSNKYYNLKLQGTTNNINAIGAKVLVYRNGKTECYQNYPVKGFLSSMQVPIHIGLGSTIADSIIIIWPDNTYSKLNNTDTVKNKLIKWQISLPQFNYTTLKSNFNKQAIQLNNITAETNLNFVHKENSFNEFDREWLLPRMVSKDGPALAVADINNDGLDDVFCGSSKWEKSALFTQNKNGVFAKTNQPYIYADSTYEDVDASFADFNNDGFLDLAIASGGNEFYVKENWLKPRIYFNNGLGVMLPQPNAMPNIYNTQSCIKPADFNNDGYIDLFVGARATPYAYGTIPKSYLLLNNKNGTFTDVTPTFANDLATIGMVTNATWCYINNDTIPDLVVCTEWSGISAFINNTITLTKTEITTDQGWWNFVLPLDVDADGDIDIIAGNQGTNNLMQVSKSYPLQMYYNDFDGNGTKEQIVTYYKNEKEITVASKPDIEKQLPFIKKKYLYAADFANASINNMFGKNKIAEAAHFTVNNFSTMLYINNGAKGFEAKVLPWQVQLSSMRTASIINVNNDNLPDIFIAGNYYPQTMNMNESDANFGTILVNEGKGNFVAKSITNTIIKNEVRQIKHIIINKKMAYLIAQNNDSLIVVQQY